MPEMFAPAEAARVRGTLKAFPNQTVDLVSWSQDFAKIVVFTSGSGDSGTYWLVDIATGDAKPLGYSYPSVGADDVGTIQMIDWKAADGLRLHGVLSLPPAGQPRRCRSWSCRMAARRRATIRTSTGGRRLSSRAAMRCSSPISAAPTVTGPHSATPASGNGDARCRATSPTASRSSQGAASSTPKRACIVGCSYGGYASLAGVTVQNGLYRCAVSVAGVSDPAG